jgi:hypothetical protein
MIQFPFDPVFPEQLNWMLRPNSAVSTTEIVGGTVFIAPPADALWMLRIERYLRFCHSSPRS